MRVGGAGENDQLVAYVVADQDLDTTAVKAQLATSLASYMVPQMFVVLDAFPLNASGKLDRKALPEPVFEATVFRAPTTAAEEVVAGVRGRARCGSGGSGRRFLRARR